MAVPLQLSCLRDQARLDSHGMKGRHTQREPWVGVGGVPLKERIDFPVGESTQWRTDSVTLPSG